MRRIPDIDTYRSIVLLYHKKEATEDPIGFVAIEDLPEGVTAGDVIRTYRRDEKWSEYSQDDFCFFHINPNDTERLHLLVDRLKELDDDYGYIESAMIDILNVFNIN